MTTNLLPERSSQTLIGYGLPVLHGLKDGARLCGVPLHQTLVLVRAEALLELALRKDVRAAGSEGACGDDVGGGVALHEGARTLDVAAQGVEDDAAHGGLDRVLVLVGRHAKRDASGARAVELDGLLDLLRIEPADLGRLFKRPGFAAFEQEAPAGLVLDALPGEGAVEGGIERIVPRIGDGLGRIRILVPDHVGLGVAMPRSAARTSSFVFTLTRYGRLVQRITNS